MVKKIDKKSTAMQAIGYKEFFNYFEGITSIESCIELIKRNSRHYAKRQMTWFNKMDVHWFDYDNTILHDYTNIYDDITNKGFIKTHI